MSAGLPDLATDDEDTDGLVAKTPFIHVYLCASSSTEASERSPDD